MQKTSRSDKQKDGLETTHIPKNMSIATPA
jgi:hypothetical protein